MSETGSQLEFGIAIGRPCLGTDWARLYALRMAWGGGELSLSRTEAEGADAC